MDMLELDRGLSSINVTEAQSAFLSELVRTRSSRATGRSPLGTPTVQQFVMNSNVTTESSEPLSAAAYSEKSDGLMVGAWWSSYNADMRSALAYSSSISRTECFISSVEPFDRVIAGPTSSNNRSSQGITF